MQKKPFSRKTPLPFFFRSSGRGHSLPPPGPVAGGIRREAGFSPPAPGLSRTIAFDLYRVRYYTDSGNLCISRLGTGGRPLCPPVLRGRHKACKQEVCFSTGCAAVLPVLIFKGCSRKYSGNHDSGGTAKRDSRPCSQRGPDKTIKPRKPLPCFTIFSAH